MIRAGRGVGTAIARSATQEGAETLFNHPRSESLAEKVGEEIRSSRGAARTAAAGITDEQQTKNSGRGPPPRR
ncbi:hypothetical protein [Rubrobacter aplysinae]|uniref:hypothetical protein n=1 Tax=Rubrobacter aplysinae TaxID=909625 RepID=UPI00064C435A|nr:hypothetical protein [Rubrobacter aplysinae]